MVRLSCCRVWQRFAGKADAMDVYGFAVTPERALIHHGRREHISHTGSPPRRRDCQQASCAGGSPSSRIAQNCRDFGPKTVGELRDATAWPDNW